MKTLSLIFCLILTLSSCSTSPEVFQYRDNPWEDFSGYGFFEITLLRQDSNKVRIEWTENHDVIPEPDLIDRVYIWKNGLPWTSAPAHRGYAVDPFIYEGNTYYYQLSIRIPDIGFSSFVGDSITIPE